MPSVGFPPLHPRAPVRKRSGVTDGRQALIHEHWFYIWAAGDGCEPLVEHLWALNQYGYDGPFNVGIVGERHQRVEALDELHWTRKFDLVIEAKLTSAGDQWARDDVATVGRLVARDRSNRDGTWRRT